MHWEYLRRPFRRASSSDERARYEDVTHSARFVREPTFLYSTCQVRVGNAQLYPPCQHSRASILFRLPELDAIPFRVYGPSESTV